MPVTRSVRRVALLRKLSPRGVCALCAEKHAHAELEVDHASGRLWESNRVDSLSRVERYERERAAGVELRAICRGCSAKQGGMRYQRRGGDRVSPRSSATAARDPHPC